MLRERFKLIPTSHLILIRNNRILLLRRFNTGFEDGKYSIIAGHLDGDETIMEAMEREAKEEAGIEIDELEVVHVMHRKAADERIDLFIRADKWTGEPEIMEPNKCDDLRWFNLHSLPENMVPYVRQAIEHIQNNTFYSEHGWHA